MMRWFFSVVLLVLLGFHSSYAQSDDLEIPRLLITVNDIVDLPIDGFQRFVLTSQGVIDVENLPNNVLRLTAKSTGTTLLFVWDAKGRSTYQVEVTGFAPNIVPDFRPGYNPQGSEFIYRSTMNNLYTNQGWLDPFWTHDFSSSVPVGRDAEWRTILNANTNNNGLNNSYGWSPFSQSTYPNQMLSYYRDSNKTLALGDVNFNPGQLSLIGYPIRGGLIEYHQKGSRDRAQLFAGMARPRNRNNYVFQDPSESVFGFAGTKDLWPNISMSSSFVYVNSPENFSPFGQTHQDDYVMDISVSARPISGLFAFEGEVAKSKDDKSLRGLLEYTPHWGRVALLYREVGEDYINPTSFFLVRNFREGSLISDVQLKRDLAFNFNYQVAQIGSNSQVIDNDVVSHRAALTSVYQKTDQISYLFGTNVSFADSDLNMQRMQRVFATYQWFDPITRDQKFIQTYFDHNLNEFEGQGLRRYGPGVDARIVKNHSRILNVSYFQRLQLNNVNNETGNLDLSFLETFYTLGSILNYQPSRTIYSAGFSNNLVFRDLMENVTNLLQPFVSAYFNPNRALTLGARINYNFEPSTNYHFMSMFGELVYRFGSRVPDTLKSAFVGQATIEGFVFIDENGDGVHQDSEQIISDAQVLVDDEVMVVSTEGRFSQKVKAGRKRIHTSLPQGYAGYFFTQENPQTVFVYPAKSEQVAIGIQKRIGVHGRVFLEDPYVKEQSAPDIEGIVVEMTVGNIQKRIPVSKSGFYNSFVPEEGQYAVRLKIEELPAGFRNVSPPLMQVEVKEGQINAVDPFVITARRRVVGFAFVDKNKNGRMDDGEAPLEGVRITIGNMSVRSSTDGSFVLDNVPEGTHPILVDQRTMKGKVLRSTQKTLSIPKAGSVELFLAFE